MWATDSSPLTPAATLYPAMPELPPSAFRPPAGTPITSGEASQSWNANASTP